MKYADKLALWRACAEWEKLQRRYKDASDEEREQIRRLQAKTGINKIIQKMQGGCDV